MAWPVEVCAIMAEWACVFGYWFLVGLGVNLVGVAGGVCGCVVDLWAPTGWVGGSARLMVVGG